MIFGAGFGKYQSSAMSKVAETSGDPHAMPGVPTKLNVTAFTAGIACCQACGGDDRSPCCAAETVGLWELPAVVVAFRHGTAGSSSPILARTVAHATDMPSVMALFSVKLMAFAEVVSFLDTPPPVRSPHIR